MKTTKIKSSNEPVNNSFTFLFGKRNYIYIGIGLFLIALGFILMSGYDANTRPDGKFDVNYWNDDIFSWRRIRLAPLLIIIGFVVEVYAVLINPENKKERK